MRFGIFLVAVLAIAVIYMSCNKHSIQKPITGSTKVLNGWAYSDAPNQRNELSFDAHQKVAKEESSHDVTSYDFVGDSVIITEFNKDEGRQVLEFRGKLDNSKRLTSGVAISTYIATAPDTVRHVFLYNKDGFLTTEKRLSLADTFLVEYEYEHNLVTVVKTFTNGVLYNTKQFTYYDNDLSYSLPEETKFKRNINNLVGASGHKLVKKVVSTGRNGKEKYRLNCEYQMDPNGYASKMISKKGKKVNGVITFYYGEPSNVPGNAVTAR